MEEIHYEKKEFLKLELWNEELLLDDMIEKYFEQILRDLFKIFFFDKNNKQKKTISKNQEDFLQWRVIIRR